MAGILFDARWVRPGKTGVGNFVYNLLQALPNTQEKIGIILPIGSPYAKSFERFQIFFSPIDLTDHPWTEGYEQLFIPYLCYRHKFKNFVSFEGRAPICHPGIKTFSFVYDLTFLTIKGSHNKKYSSFLYTSLALTKKFSTRVVTISNKIRLDLVNRANVPSEKIMLVYPADSRLNQYASVPVTGLKKPFFLTVGITNRRKNLANLLNGFALFNQKYHGYQLAVTGNAEWIEEVCQKLSIPNVVNLGFVSEGELRFLYENTLGLIYPSLDEGFGIPLLDALQFNCPVVCSDIPVFREVMEDCAIYFDPLSSESISSGLDASLAHPKSVTIRRILDKFSWEKSAEKFVAEISAIS